MKFSKLMFLVGCMKWVSIAGQGMFANLNMLLAVFKGTI